MAPVDRDPAPETSPPPAAGATAPLAPGKSAFDDRAAFRAAVLQVLRAARESLLLVDRDFSDWPIESADGEAALREALRAGVRLRLLVLDPEWLARHGARFARLRRVYGDRIECRTVPGSLRMSDSLVVSDRRHAVRRVPPDAMRGWVLAEMPAEAAAAAERPEAVWEESEPCLPATTLGL